jgi:hypothetical protein
MNSEASRNTTFPSTPGGVMTDEAGAITGDLEVETRIEESGAVAVRVRYAGANEWYTVTGSPVALDASEADLHEQIVGRLRTPGPLVGGNEEAVSLRGMNGS